jgi:hypothetical protein
VRLLKAEVGKENERSRKDVAGWEEGAGVGQRRRRNQKENESNDAVQEQYGVATEKSFL